MNMSDDSDTETDFEKAFRRAVWAIAHGVPLIRQPAKTFILARISCEIARAIDNTHSDSGGKGNTDQK
jgi:hypothetical protein